MTTGLRTPPRRAQPPRGHRPRDGRGRDDPQGGGPEAIRGSTRRGGRPPASGSPACSTRPRRSSKSASGPRTGCTRSGAARRRRAWSRGSATVAGRRVMVVANDATVKAGACFPLTIKKILRAQRIAGENRLPLVYLVDSSGVFLPMQDEVFPDEDDFGRIFRNNAVLSAAGRPAVSRRSWATASPAGPTCRCSATPC